MEIRNGKYGQQQRRGISPIIATVLIIAVTLIAAVAIGGFVFGIFGSASSTANITVTNVAVPAGALVVAGTTSTYSCATAPIAGDANIALSNSGTAAASATGVTLTWAGQSNTYSPSALCTVGAAGAATASEYLNFPITDKILTAGVTGQTFSGTISVSNGASVLFTGTFQ